MTLQLEVSILSGRNRFYPYEKNIVINALYDTLDTLGLVLCSVNSVRGELIVCDSESTEEIHILLISDERSNETEVRILVREDDVNRIDSWCDVILDELTGRMHLLNEKLKGKIILRNELKNMSW